MIQTCRLKVDFSQHIDPHAPPVAIDRSVFIHSNRAAESRFIDRRCVAAAFGVPSLADSALKSAVGSTTYSLRPRRPGGPSKSRFSTTIHNALLANPFSLTVLFFGCALASASILIPGSQLAPLDKVVALLESIAMFYIAYPAAVATGKVLLQTAPPMADFGAGEMNALRRALDEVHFRCSTETASADLTSVWQIENHPSVVFLPPAHVWQLTPHPPPVSAASTQPSSFGRKSLPHTSSISREPITTVVTLNVQVKPESTDSEILDLTRWCREKCGYALLGAGANLRSGTAGGTKGQQKSLELSVQVVRFDEQRALQAEIGHGHSHDHDHGHGHSHDHGGGRGSHDRGHGHDHGHGHGLTNGHAEHNEHDSHGHSSHSHDHGSNHHGHQH